MKQKLLFLVLVLMVLASSILAKKMAVLPEIKRPHQLIALKERALVVEGTTIFVYSLNDYKLLTKFGKMGEGPQEFKVRPGDQVHVYPKDDYIYVSSMGKASVFTKDGKFVREVPAVTGRKFTPLGHTQYVAIGRITEGKKAFRTIDLFDSNLKKTKTVFKQSDILQGPAVRVYFTSLAFSTYDDKIFMTGRKGFIIDVFDNKGEPLFTIKRDYKKIKITRQIQQNVLDWFKQDPRYDDRTYQYIKANIRFPDYFPAIDEMIIKDDKIYVRTHQVKGDDYEFVIFDIKGKYLKTKFIHLVRENSMYPYPYDIANGNAYQLVEDLDKETWELHCNAIK